MTFTTKYGLGDIVYVITDPEQEARMITNVTFFPGGYFYTTSLGASVSTHYEMEISVQADIKKQLNISSHEQD